VKDRKNVVLMERDIVSFTVVNKGGQLGAWMGREPGFLKPGFVWEHKI